jgi:L-rhamnose mutarotase
MIRKAVLFQCRPGMAAEYERRHNPIWRELEKLLKEHGCHNYSIYIHDKTGMLFGYVEIEDEKKLERIGENELCQRWWGEMTKLLVCESEGAAKGKEEPLREVFHLDGNPGVKGARIRKAVLFQCKPGKAAEYERRHNPLPAEGVKLLREHGAHNYSIYIHDPTGMLFGYLEIEDEAKFQPIADTEFARRSWREMAELLVCESADSQKGKEEPLREVFHLD